MSRTYVIVDSGLLPECHKGSAGVADDRVDARRPPSLVLEQLAPEADRLFRGDNDVVDLHIGDPAADVPLLRRDARERRSLSSEHSHPGRSVRGVPAKEFLVELSGGVRLIAA